MCPGVPYAIAAKFAFPDRVAIALVGDGAMQMLGNNELITISKYWKEWSDPRLVVLVLNNRDLNQVTWEQRVLEGDPKYEASQDIPDFPFARYAELLGLRGIRCALVERRIEPHLLGFDGDLYGSRLVVELWSRLRDEQTFRSEHELVKQIALDVEAARTAVRPS